MAGLICVQGGDEFTDACREVDEAWIRRAPQGTVSVVPLACASGIEYRTAGRNGVEYLGGLGLEDVELAPEPDLLPDDAVRSIIESAVVFIPGGSPRRIRRRVIGTAVGHALRTRAAWGGMLVGASAGAMVLGHVMFVPGRDTTVHAGLDVLPDVLVLPHYDATHEELAKQMRARVSDDVVIVGVPACAGVLYGDGDPVAFGDRPCWQFAPDGEATQIPRE